MLVRRGTASRALVTVSRPTTARHCRLSTSDNRCGARHAPPRAPHPPPPWALADRRLPPRNRPGKLQAPRPQRGQRRCRSGRAARRAVSRSACPHVPYLDGPDLTGGPPPRGRSPHPLRVQSLDKDNCIASRWSILLFTQPSYPTLRFSCVPGCCQPLTGRTCCVTTRVSGHTGLPAAATALAVAQPVQPPQPEICEGCSWLAARRRLLSLPLGVDSQPQTRPAAAALRRTCSGPARALCGCATALLPVDVAPTSSAVVNGLSPHPTTVFPHPPRLPRWWCHPGTCPTRRRRCAAAPVVIKGAPGLARALTAPTAAVSNAAYFFRPGPLVSHTVCPSPWPPLFASLGVGAPCGPPAAAPPTAAAMGTPSAAARGRPCPPAAATGGRSANARASPASHPARRRRPAPRA